MYEFYFVCVFVFVFCIYNVCVDILFVISRSFIWVIFMYFMSFHIIFMFSSTLLVLRCIFMIAVFMSLSTNTIICATELYVLIDSFSTGFGVLFLCFLEYLLLFLLNYKYYEFYVLGS